MKINFPVLFVLALWVGLLTGCQEEIDLQSRQFKSEVYVDGGITNEPGPYRVKIFRSARLDDPERIPYTNCHVSIQQESGESETLAETEPGVYQSSSEGIRGRIGNSYRIVFETPGGETYQSDYTEMKTPVKIDTVYGKTEKVEKLNPINDLDGYQFYVSTQQGNDDSYLLWKMEETYEYTSDYRFAGTMYRGERNVVDEGKDSLYRCWKTQNVNQIFTANTHQLQTPSITNKPLHYVDNRSKRLQYRYSLKVKQYTINRDAYTFWDNVKEQIAAGDFLSVRQPFQIPGNVYNAEDEEEVVLGYFNVASVDQRRIFIRPEMTLKLRTCGIQYFVLNLWGISMQQVVYFGYGPGGVGKVDKFCVDCRESGGKLEKPEFWPDK